MKLYLSHFVAVLAMALFCSDLFAATDYNTSRSNRSAGIIAQDQGDKDLERIFLSAKKAMPFLIKDEADNDPNAELDVRVEVKITVCKVDKETGGSNCTNRGQCAYGKC